MESRHTEENLKVSEKANLPNTKYSWKCVEIAAVHKEQKAAHLPTKGR